MRVKKIKLNNFRNIETAELDFCDGTTVLNGKNGQGKTNLLEAVYIPARGRSFRTAHENEFISFGQDLCELKMTWWDGKRDNDVIFRWMKSGQTVRRFCMKNRVPITRLSELVGSFRAVLFCPEHLALVQSGPAERRKFLDIAISQTDGAYLRSLQKYNTLLAQRNALIKKAVFSGNDRLFYESADIWSEQLAAEAETISAKRDEYVALLGKAVAEIVSDMTGEKEKVGFLYHDRKTKEEYFRLLTENTERELKQGMTLFGVQKDDVEILMNGRDSRLFCSQGQQRTIALAMKIAEGELSRQFGGDGEYPVYLFDDILSELDEGRRNYLLSGIADKQVIITSCERIDGLVGRKTLVYKVEDGRFYRG